MRPKKRPADRQIKKQSASRIRALADLRTAPGVRGIKAVFFDFDGVFTDNSVWVTEDGIELVRCCGSDGYGLSALKRCGIPAVIISSEVNSVVSKRAAKLGVPAIRAIEDKAAAVRQYCLKLGCRLENAVFVGNDINDIPALKSVGFPIVVKDCHPAARRFGRYITKTPGGCGAVREICDALVSAREQTRSSQP